MTSLIIETTKEGEKKQKSIPYVNPQATDSELIAFAQGLVDLTTQTYESTTLIDKRNLDTDSKADYNVDFKTARMNNSTGANEVVVISADTASVDLNVNALPSNNTIVVSLRGLTPYTAPYYEELTVNSAEGTVINRSSTYWTDDTPTTSARRTWTMDLILGGSFVAGDSFNYKIKVNGNSTYNAYERTLTCRFVEWTGGEG